MIPWPTLGVAFCFGALFGFEVFDRVEAYRARAKDLIVANLTCRYIDNGMSLDEATGRALREMRGMR